MAEHLRQIPLEYSRPQAFEQKPSRIGGVIKGGIGKVADVAAGVSKYTIWGFGGMWAAAEFAPGAVASAGFSPETVGNIGKWGTIFDAGTLLVDKFRKKDKGTSSFSRSGNIFVRAAKDVGGEVIAWPKTAGSQLVGKAA